MVHGYRSGPSRGSIYIEVSQMIGEGVVRRRCDIGGRLQALTSVDLVVNAFNPSEDEEPRAQPRTS